MAPQGMSEGLPMPPHADYTFTLYTHVSWWMRKWAQILACTGGTKLYRSERGQPLYSCSPVVSQTFSAPVVLRIAASALRRSAFPF